MSENSCGGFRASGVACGLKKNGGKDLGLLYSETPAQVAGVFTRNRVQAAPVRLDRERIGSGVCRAVVVNSGNANCCTGEQGMRDARSTARLAAEALGVPEHQVLVASTGVIGNPMPMDRIRAGLPRAAEQLRPEGIEDLAESIMTTDLVPKIARREVDTGSGVCRIVGVAKGSGMIRPDMATMLCFVCTDAEVPAPTLQRCLAAATERSFNRITVDGDTSTNDTVLLMAGGASGVRIGTGPGLAAFQQQLDDLLVELAKAIVRDGEGATKLVEIRVRRCATNDDARVAADTIANSNLVKTAFFGEDANWGRIFGAAGRAGVALDPERLDLYFDDVQMVRAGVGCGPAAEALATEVLKRKEFTVTLDLNAGTGRARCWTCDFSLDYVRINADYRS